LVRTLLGHCGRRVIEGKLIEIFGIKVGYLVRGNSCSALARSPLV